jgi:hypothetical protein
MHQRYGDEHMTSPTVSLQALKDSAEQAVNDCFEKAQFWKWVYYVMRSSLIVFAALTSAEAINTISVLPGAQPYFALLVTIISAFDAWLKPGAKYRAYYLANDEYAQLGIDVDLLPPTDPDGPRGAAKRYAEINDRLSKTITPD